MLHARALNVPLDGTPEWIQLLPPGPAIAGRDGRAWTLPDPQTVVTAFQARGQPLVVDWEHASEHRAPQGLDAPAAGWIDRLEARDGAVWGHVEWTERAAAQIAAREYRFLSPVFTYRKADGAIVGLLSVGLTNQPNLPLTALNREEPPMPLSAALCTALDLAQDADETAVLTAIAALKTDLATAQNRAKTPPPDKFVPRADLDAALARASNAETRLAEVEAERREAEIETLIQQALTGRQISPATLDYYRACCRAEGGVDLFRQFLSVAPALLPDTGAPAGAPPAPAPKAPKALNRAAFANLNPREQREFIAAGGSLTD